MKKQTKVWLSLAIALSILSLASGCGNKEAADTNKETNAGGAAAQKYSGPTGTVSGVVSFAGTPAAPKKIDTSADPVCGQKNPNLTVEDTVVKDGKLANVFVYVKDGQTADGKKIGDFTWDTPTSAVTLDQNGCHYRPHILGIQTNQKLNITNSDPTQHNIHWTPKVNPEWNQSQPNGAPPIEKSFARAEILVPVKCNQHPWMRAFIGVMKSPFFAVSAEDGTFTIKGLPAGKYTVVAWHEAPAPAGTEKTMEVTVPANGAGKADFSFGGAAATSVKPSLEIVPAIEVPVIGTRH